MLALAAGAHQTDFVLLIAMYAFTAFGMTVGFHRMLTHRSFRPHPVVKLVLLVLGSMGVEAPPIEWAATYIKHHAQSDREGDAHSLAVGLHEFEVGTGNLYQTLLVKSEKGKSGLPLTREDWYTRSQTDKQPSHPDL